MLSITSDIHNMVQFKIGDEMTMSFPKSRFETSKLTAFLEFLSINSNDESYFYFIGDGYTDNDNGKHFTFNIESKNGLCYFRLFSNIMDITKNSKIDDHHFSSFNMRYPIGTNTEILMLLRKIFPLV
jgi:hypothetical protein